MKSLFFFLTFLFLLSSKAQEGFNTKVSLAEEIFLMLEDAEVVKSKLEKKGYQVGTDDSKHSVYFKENHVLDIHFDSKHHIQYIMMYFQTLDHLKESFFGANYYSCEGGAKCYEKKVPAVQVQIDFQSKSFKMYRIGSMF